MPLSNLYTAVRELANAARATSSIVHNAVGAGQIDAAYNEHANEVETACVAASAAYAEHRREHRELVDVLREIMREDTNGHRQLPPLALIDRAHAALAAFPED